MSLDTRKLGATFGRDMKKDKAAGTLSEFQARGGLASLKDLHKDENKASPEAIAINARGPGVACRGSDFGGSV